MTSATRSSQNRLAISCLRRQKKIVDQRPNPAKVTQSCDVFVAERGLMCLTDTNAGLYILQYEGS